MTIEFNKRAEDYIFSNGSKSLTIPEGRLSDLIESSDELKKEILVTYKKLDQHKKRNIGILIDTIL